MSTEQIVDSPADGTARRAACAAVTAFTARGRPGGAESAAPSPAGGAVLVGAVGGDAAVAGGAALRWTSYGDGVACWPTVPGVGALAALAALAAFGRAGDGAGEAAATADTAELRVRISAALAARTAGGCTQAKGPAAPAAYDTGGACAACAAGRRYEAERTAAQST